MNNSGLNNNLDTILKLVDWYQWSSEKIQQHSDAELKEVWETEAIDAEEYVSWITEMEAIIHSKYKLYLPMLQDLLTNKISYETFEQLDVHMQAYIENIYQLFQKERVEAHQKFAFQLGGELQEKLEVQTLLYKLISPVTEGIYEHMKKCSNQEQKYIVMYLQLIIETPINQLTNLVVDYAFVQDILKEFHTLKQAQFENFFEDTKDFIEHQQERDARYNALMYKMRKQLVKQQADL